MSEAGQSTTKVCPLRLPKPRREWPLQEAAPIVHEFPPSRGANHWQALARACMPAMCALLLGALMPADGAMAQSGPRDDPDNDAILNFNDLDDDNDGVPDTLEGFSLTCTTILNKADRAETNVPSQFNYGGVSNTNDGNLATWGGIHGAAISGTVTYGFNSAIWTLRSIRFYSNGGNIYTDGQVRQIGRVEAFDAASNSLAFVVNVAVPTAMTSAGYTTITFPAGDIYGVSEVRFTNLVDTTGAEAIWRDVHYEVCTPVTLDTDGDSIPDHIDLDSDNDGISDLAEAGGVAVTNIVSLATTYPGGRYPSSPVNANGISTLANGGTGWTRGTGLNLDSDSDGIPDAIEAQPTVGYASVNESSVNSAGVNTNVGLVIPRDTESDGTPDFRDTNSDIDALLDSAEITAAITVTYAIYRWRHQPVDAEEHPGTRYC